MKKQNVLIVHNHYQIPGGEDTVVANEKRLLEENGHEVVFYSRDNSEIKGFSIFRKLLLPLTAIFSIKTYRDVKRIIEEKHIDIVHVHNTLSLISPSVYYAALNSKVPVVQTIHNFRLICPGAMFYRDGHICEDCVRHGLGCAVRYRCYRGSMIQTFICVLSLMMHRATGIYKKITYICLTEFNKGKLLQFGQIKPYQIHVKPNFVARTEDIVPAEEREDQVVFAGRLDRTKGVDVMFEAWALMGENGPKLVVCGTGPMEGWCRRFIDGHQLRSIEMKGIIPNEEVRKILAVSKAAILPTQLYEGFPMGIVEAYAAGTPVVVSDLGNVASIVVEGICGSKCRPGSPEDLVRAVQRLMSYGDIVTSTDMEYKRRYTKEENYRCLIDIYQNAR